MKKAARRKFDKVYLLVVALAVGVLVPFLSDLYVEGDDTYYHLANVESLASGSWLDLFTTQIFNGIGGDLGYGAGLFYPQLSHIVAAVFVKLGFGVIGGVKMSHILAMILSGLLMYKLLKMVTKNRLAALAAAVLYMAAPYHLADIYTRDALAEVWVFAFLPLAFMGLVYFWQKKYKWFYLCFILGFAGMANTHLVLTMYAAILLFICLMLKGREFWKWEVWKKFILAAVGVLLLTAPMIVSVATMKMSGVEYVAWTDEMSSSGWAENDALWPWQMVVFVPGVRDLFMFTISIVGLGLVIYAGARIKKKDWILKSGLFLVVGGVWLASKLWLWIIMPGFLCTIQFPWRLSLFICFGVSLVSGFALARLKINTQKVVAGLIMASSVFYVVAIIMNTNFVKIDMNSAETAEHFYDEAMGWQREYLPVVAKENLEYFDNRDSEAVVDLRDGLVELPRIYYPGYEVKVNGEVVKYGMSENGFVKVEAEIEDEISYEYTGTIGMRVAKVAQATGIIYLIFIVILTRRR